MRKWITTFALASAVALTVCSPARAAGPDPGMRSAVDAFVTAMNTGGPAATSCATSTTIVDDFAPYVWSGPGACAKWLGAFAQLTAAMGVTNVKVSAGKTLYADGDASHGELVIATRFTGLIKGKSHLEAGAWTFVLANASGSWKFSAIAWSHTGNRR
jgi:hypothetical protein